MVFAVFLSQMVWIVFSIKEKTVERLSIPKCSEVSKIMIKLCLLLSGFNRCGTSDDRTDRCDKTDGGALPFPSTASSDCHR